MKDLYVIAHNAIEDSYENFDLGQDEYEIQTALNFIISHFGKKLNSFIEIGSKGGGTFNILSSISNSDAFRLMIDLPSGEFGGISKNKCKLRYDELFTRYGDYCEILGDSHDIHTRDKVVNLVENTVNKVDLLFIDGDHSYNGVKLDYEMYRNLVLQNGIIMFHDIANGKNQISAGCEVPRFWYELINSGYYKKENCIEIIKNRNAAYQYGIGIIINS